MITWFTWLQAAIALVACVIALVVAIRGQKPNDASVGALALSGILLIVQSIIALLAPLWDNAIRGDGLEFWMYVIGAIIIVVAAVLWSLIERERWSNGVLAIAAFSIAVMVIRMQQVWDANPPVLGA